jgi:hypothetical protein
LLVFVAADTDAVAHELALDCTNASFFDDVEDGVGRAVGDLFAGVVDFVEAQLADAFDSGLGAGWLRVDGTGVTETG